MQKKTNMHDVKNMHVVVYYCTTYYKAVRAGGEEDSRRHVLLDATNLGLCGP